MSLLLQTKFRASAKQSLYRWGALGAIHRRRNADTLSVLMFHRVVAPHAPSWPGANPLFTMSTGFFEQLLVFIKRHYNPVTLGAVARAQEGETPLPPRALLITFDDGWSDNAEFAVPLLKEAGVPAVFFVATGAIRSGLAFWQERFFAVAMSAGPYDKQWMSVVAAPDSAKNFPAYILEVISTLESQGAAAGVEMLQSFLSSGEVEMPRMMRPDDISRIAEDPLFEFGTHGVTHTPFTDLPDPTLELVGSWDDLSAWCEPGVQSLSFPHGRCTPDILALAKSSGYELIFDSAKILGQISDRLTRRSFGRFEVRPPGSDPLRSDFGHYEPDEFDAGRIASEMFFRPICSERPEFNIANSENIEAP